MTEFRLRTARSPYEVAAMAGKLPTDDDYDVLLTGPARVRKPDGSLLAVYLPRELAELGPAHYPVLHELRRQTTTNRGLASATVRLRPEGGTRSYTEPIASAIVGAVDPGGQQRYCRLTAWTGRHLPEWESLAPLLAAIDAAFRREVPDRYAAQAAYVARTAPEWVVPGTAFTTITVNNTYPTGIHKDSGDLPEGFSNLSVLRRGSYRGGIFVWPRFGVAVDAQDGDLVLMDAHEWHGNTALVCDHVDGPLNGPCPSGCERISIVAYYRTRMAECGSAEAELARAEAVAARRSK